jgi:TRAP-type C4-dicarboxylate transport system substrate-binding protein
MKFYEVTSQIVLTSHLIGFDLFVVSKRTWDSLSAEQRQKLESETLKAIDWSTQKHLDEEARLVQFFKDQGLKVYEPDLGAFREHAQQMYLESEFAKNWPDGMLDKINAL